ncbi:regulatory signaling modulator protein AmpE [Marinobacter orientalis]|uniref:Regulatory signaling modulator protein AmpE n=1 Tax=Marinobacter orientalis TaxID=1928859 RepID=A0A7Y0RFM4_9GAMM|nr:regulatory signaling modulator protein AmpE [Marinobacter orientalis]NMT65369.1 regulatory signaling modulator protein AmpE [Marinobacter orientalis]TGX47602.1 histidine kinase [Marinobacter orientalis]
MALVVFLLAYLTRRKLDAANAWSGDSLWRAAFRASSKMSAGNGAGKWKGLLVIAVPAVVLAVGVGYLDKLGWRMAAYPLEFVLLVTLMGAPGWRSPLEAYSTSWARGDMQAAWHHIKDNLPPRDRGAAASPDEMHLLLSRTLMAHVFERFFLVAFWYVVAGPAAAFFARGIIALRDHWPQTAARPDFAALAEVLNWLPARLLAFTFGVAGDLAGWMSEGKRVLAGITLKTDQVLMAAANSALTGYALDPGRFSQIHPDEWPGYGRRSLDAIRGLLNRSMLVWICLLALLVIAGVV